MSADAPSPAQLASFVRVAAQADISFATLQTHAGYTYPISGVCAALTNTSRAERPLAWIDNSHIVQDHAATTAEYTAEEILQPGALLRLTGARC